MVPIQTSVCNTDSYSITIRIFYQNSVTYLQINFLGVEEFMYIVTINKIHSNSQIKKGHNNNILN